MEILIVYLLGMILGMFGVFAILDDYRIIKIMWTVMAVVGAIMALTMEIK